MKVHANLLRLFPVPYSANGTGTKVSASMATQTQATRRRAGESG